MLPSPDEIEARILARQDADPLAIERLEYVYRLPWERARRFMDPAPPREGWMLWTREPAFLTARIRGQIEPAWEAANDCNSLTVQAAIYKLIAWLWLSGERELAGWVADAYENRYAYYGKPILQHLAVLYGIEWLGFDDDRWRDNSEDPGISAAEALSEWISDRPGSAPARRGSPRA